MRVLFAGICGSDLHEYYRGPVLTRADEPHPITGIKNPVILGHELSGEVVDVGAGVEDVEPGQLVAVRPTQACGRCPRCAEGLREQCEQKAVHGLTRAGGGFSEFTSVARSMAFVLPPEMTAEQGALIEPMSVGLTAARRTLVEPGEIAAVYGVGPIGLGTALALRAMGVETIILDPSPLRREVASRLGFTHVLDPTEVDGPEAVKELTGGVGAAGSVDAAGVPEALHAAIASTAYDRNVTIVAVPLEPIVLPVVLFRRGLVHLTASSGNQDFPSTIEAMARGDYPLQGWISKIALHGIVSDGIEPLHRQEKMKVLVDLSAS